MKIVSDSININFEYFNSFEPDRNNVLMLHGFSGSLDDWREIHGLLNPNFNYIGLDLVGHGNSDSPVNVDKYSPQALSNQINDFLINLSIEQVIICAYSMGGRATLSFAINHPNKIRGLILEGTTAGIEREKIRSIERFAALPEEQYRYAVASLDQLRPLMLQPVPAIFIPRDETVYERNPDIQGPMNAFGYSFLEDKLGAEEMNKLAILKHSTGLADGGMLAYELLNFVDGKRTVSDIRDWLVAEFGTVPPEYVAEYLQALESIDVVRMK